MFEIDVSRKVRASENRPAGRGGRGGRGARTGGGSRGGPLRGGPAAAAKAKQNPSVKMKALNWDKIGRVAGTIWYSFPFSLSLIFCHFSFFQALID